MTAAILVAIVSAIIAGGSGFYLSFQFHKSKHSRTDRSGDFGAPRGAFLSTLSGTVIGMLFISVIGKRIFPVETIEVGLVAAMVVGLVGGIAGMIAGTGSRAN